jgi:NAD(P)-dependent dehydrogenase (short-subunit alcohol dehydrogenase family)
MAIALASGGDSLTIVARDEAKGKAAVAEIRARSGNPTVTYLTADLASQASVRSLAETALRELPRLNVLVNNAGVYLPDRRLTPEGIEMTFAVNHLAPFLLTNLLLDRLRANAPSRIVNTASTAHRSGRIHFDSLRGEGGYRGFVAYAQSKLANVLFTHALARRLGDGGVTVNCFHPGVVRSGLWHRGIGGRLVGILGYPFMISPEKGAWTGVYLITSPEVEKVTGKYFARSREEESSPRSMDREVEERLWKLSAELCKMPP